MAIRLHIRKECVIFEGGSVKVGSLVKRKHAFGEWVQKNPWMLDEKDLETGIVIRIGQSGYWDYEVLWQGDYTETHDEAELEEIE